MPEVVFYYILQHTYTPYLHFLNCKGKFPINDLTTKFLSPVAWVIHSGREDDILNISPINSAYFCTRFEKHSWLIFNTMWFLSVMAKNVRPYSSWI